MGTVRYDGYISGAAIAAALPAQAVSGTLVITSANGQQVTVITYN